MKIAYVVTQGSYSDYSIRGVFDNKELAEQFIAAFSEAQRYDAMEIEEWGLNPFKVELGKGYKPYFVRMDREGNSSEARISGSAYEYEGELEYGFDVNKNMYNHCFAKGSEHAIKITNERRVQLIADGKWLSK